MSTRADHAYVMVSGSVRVTTVDEDNQELVVDEPKRGEFFGFASMLEQTPHQTEATAAAETVCIEVDRNAILALIQRKPDAAMDMLGVLGRQFHAAQQMIRFRTLRHPNEVIEEQDTLAERIADGVAAFGGSWTFIITFAILMAILHRSEFVAAHAELGPLSLHSSQPLPFHDRSCPGPRHHDEPEPAGQKGPTARRA